MLKGQRVNVRTVRERDLDVLFDLDSDIQSRGPYFPLEVSSERTMRLRWEEDGFWGKDRGRMLIVDAVDDRILGALVYFTSVPYYSAFELGYIIFRPEDRGKGYLSEGLKLFVRYLFDLHPISRLQIQAEAPNLASRKAAEGAGFRHEGTARAAIISRGEPLDLEVYSLIRADLDSA